MEAIRTFKVDLLDVWVHENRRALGEAAGADAIAYLRARLKAQDVVSVIFGAAPSQNEFLQALCAAEGIDWQRVHAFHMDEYVGLVSDAPQGFANFLRRGIWDALPFGAVHCLDGNAADIDAECARYGALLTARPIDAVFMGIGENGHIAFNDPPVADFADAALVKRVMLDDVCRQQQVNDGCFAAIEEVPVAALTLTVPALMRGERLFCMVPAKTKRSAVTRTLREEISTACPASILRTHPRAALYVDKDSGRDFL